MTPEQEEAGKRLHTHLKDTPGLVSVGANEVGFIVYVNKRADSIPLWWEGWPVTVSRVHGSLPKNPQSWVVDRSNEADSVGSQSENEPSRAKPVHGKVRPA